MRFGAGAGGLRPPAPQGKVFCPAAPRSCGSVAPAPASPAGFASPSGSASLCPWSCSAASEPFGFLGGSGNLRLPMTNATGRALFPCAPSGAGAFRLWLHACLPTGSTSRRFACGFACLVPQLRQPPAASAFAPAADRRSAAGYASPPVSLRYNFLGRRTVSFRQSFAGRKRSKTPACPAPKVGKESHHGLGNRKVIFRPG